MAISALAVRKIGRKNVVELLKGARIARPQPKFSVWKSAAAVLCIGMGYVLTLLTYRFIILSMFPIVLLTVTGTYFLFTRFSVLITRWLKSRPAVFYRGTHMITLSQIIYKLKDHARILFLVVVMGAVVLTSAGILFSIQGELGKAGENVARTMGVLIFIGAFIALLFFTAMGSILYFKLFNEMKSDRKEFLTLQKTGMTRLEVRKIIRTQTAVIFFLPCFVAAAHAVVAMQSLELLHGC